MKQRGFTVIELLVVTAFVLTAGILFFVQKNNIETANRDEHRKIAINSIYYSLEESYYPKHKFYPESITKETLPSVDPSLLTDPHGVKIGQTNVTVNGQDYPVQSDYRYEPSGCTDGQCTGYSLRADLENEADYVKTNRKN